jgi:hypothetical protein
MREKGEVPFEQIADNTRATYGPQSFDSPSGCISAAAERFRQRVWTDAQCQVWVFTEKDALATVLGHVTARYDVPLCVARGYSSITYLHEIAEAIATDGRPCFIYHFGDHDPSGQDAARDTEEKLRRYAAELHGSDVAIHFERVAVTPEQIEEWDLPSRPTKMKDTRARKFGRDTSVELDAIPVDKLRQLVRTRIKRHIRKKRFKALLLTEKKNRRRLERIATELRRAASGGQGE